MMLVMTLIYHLQTYKFMLPTSPMDQGFHVSNGMHFLMMQRKFGTPSASMQKHLSFDLFWSRNTLNLPIFKTENPLQGSSNRHHLVKQLMSMTLATLPHVFMNFMGETHHLKLLLIQLLNHQIVPLQCMKTSLNLKVNPSWPMLPTRNQYHLATSRDSYHQLLITEPLKVAGSILRRSI